MDSRLTDGMIAEILTRHGELLQAYQNQIRELTEEYNTENELIEITQLRSPRYGVVGKSSNQISLDQVYQNREKNIRRQFAQKSSVCWRHRIKYNRYICAICICQNSKKKF